MTGVRSDAQKQAEVELDNFFFLFSGGCESPTVRNDVNLKSMIKLLMGGVKHQRCGGCLTYLRKQSTLSLQTAEHPLHLRLPRPP